MENFASDVDILMSQMVAMIAVIDDDAPFRRASQRLRRAGFRGGDVRQCSGILEVSIGSRWLAWCWTSVCQG